jgi:hypothetical protein
MKEEKLSAADERKLLEILEQSSLHDYPNPDRVGCPETSFLHTLAFDRKSILISDARLDHVAHCSPCFRQFVGFRKQAGWRKGFHRAIAIAAMVLLTLGLSIYFAISRDHLLRTRTDLRTDIATNLDLRDVVVTRGVPDPNAPTSEEPRKLRRGHLAATVTLPPESEPGTYQFEVLGEREKPLAISQGEARIENGLTVLIVRLDLSAISPGDYSLGFRRSPQGWAYCPIRVVP